MRRRRVKEGQRRRRGWRKVERGEDSTRQRDGVRHQHMADEGAAPVLQRQRSNAKGQEGGERAREEMGKAETKAAWRRWW